MNAHQNLPKNSNLTAVLVEPEIVSVLTSTIRVQPVTFQIIQEATTYDPLLQKVIHYYHTNWPQTYPGFPHGYVFILILHHLLIENVFCYEWMPAVNGLKFFR